MPLADRDAFLREMRALAGTDARELARLSALWPAAHAAAAVCRAAMPGIGILSPRRREQAFLAVAEMLDAKVDIGEIDHEQAQLALTILRMGDGRFRKAECGFLSRLPRRDPADLARLPGTVQHYIQAINALRARRTQVEDGARGS
jgi:hypothetical protein